ncbi:MAG: DUF3089 domain-containing protein [Flavobacteriaceae bacterium]
MKSLGFRFALILALFLTVVSCKTVQIPSFTSQRPPTAPNYSQSNSWAVTPNTYPADLKHWQSTTTPLKADVFYIYPTLNIEKKDLRWNMPVDDKIQYDKIVNKAVYFQASAFLNAGKLYVPIYRQAHVRAYARFKTGGKQALDLAYADVKAAFKYYLKHYNKGRPFIIASHSQGTTHAIRLLKEFFDGKPLQKQLIAAYLPGMAIKKGTFKQIKFMTRPDQTGGFVTWNTYKKNYYPKSFNKWFKGAYVSNPITWDSQTTSTRAAHKGFLFSNGKMYKQALQVTVKDGILWTTLPHFPYRIFALNKKRYHAGDVNLFWEDIRENAVLRVKAYFNSDF